MKNCTLKNSLFELDHSSIKIAKFNSILQSKCQVQRNRSLDMNLEAGMSQSQPLLGRFEQRNQQMCSELQKLRERQQQKHSLQSILQSQFNQTYQKCYLKASAQKTSRVD